MVQRRTLGVWIVVTLLVVGTVPTPLAALAAPVLEAPTPQEATLLVAEGVAGRLAPGAAAWHEYRPGGMATGRTDAVTLFFAPAIELGARVSGVNFGIFSSGQVMSGGDVTTMSPIGAGSYVSRDGDPNTAERLWQGRLPGADPYYVRVYNDTDIEIGYWLYPDDVDRIVSPPAEPGEAEAAAGAPVDDAPRYLPWPEPAMGHLEPEEVAWYRWVLAGDVSQRQASDFTLFFTPADTLFADRVACEVMTVGQWEARISGQSAANVGAGRIVSRDGDPLTGERLWHGHLVTGEVYMVRIANGSDAPIDYWLFPGDIIHPQFPPPADPTATPAPAATETGTQGAPLATSTPTVRASTPTPVSPGDLVPSTQGNALNWEDWHVAVTCVTHCDQK
jgi:hypothetical protein